MNGLLTEYISQLRQMNTELREQARIGSKVVTVQADAIAQTVLKEIKRYL